MQPTDLEPPSIVIMQSLPRTGALHWKRLAEAARVHRAGLLAAGVRRDSEGESRLSHSSCLVKNELGNPHFSPLLYCILFYTGSSSVN